MAGHSKWANIKHKKAREDAKKGKVFTRIIREITVSAREGGGDQDSNARLRLLIEKAKKENMPQDNIIRAIKKGTGELQGESYEPIMYEGYGPGGIAVIVETLTDNKTRTVSDVRHAFSKQGGNMGEPGSVSWMFDKKGVVVLADKDLSEDEVLEKMMDHNVEDIKQEDGKTSLISSVTDLIAVKNGAEKEGYAVEDSELEWLAKNYVAIEDEVMQEKVLKFLDKLEELDDVQSVYTNIE